jgi:hypothetical protein
MENVNILTLFWASFLYTPSLKSLCQLLKRIWSYSSSSIFSSNLALSRPTSGRGFASCFPRLRLRVFHTAVRYSKRHVKLIETSAEERLPVHKTPCSLRALPRRQTVHNETFIDRSIIKWVQYACVLTMKFQSSFFKLFIKHLRRSVYPVLVSN